MALDTLTGFEFLDPLVYFDSTSGTPTIDTSTTRSGGGALKCDSSAAAGAVYAAKNLGSGTRTKALAVWFMLDQIPTGASANIISFRNASANLTVFVNTSGVISAQVAGGTVISGGSVTTNAWHLVEMSIDTSGTTYTIQWRVDSVAKTNATRASLTAADTTALWLGQSNGASRCVVWMDDVITGSATGDHPIGSYHVLSYRPNGVGTHNTPADFTLTGTTLSGSDTTSWMGIDEAPPSSVDYVEQATALGTAYLEYTLADSVEPSAPSYVAATAAVTSNSTGTNNVTVKIRDGASDGSVYSGSTGGTTTQYQSAFFATKPSTGAWTLSAFNALLMRFGFSTDVIPPPRLQSFLVEAAYPDTVNVTKTGSDSVGLAETSGVTTTGTGNVPIAGSDTAAVSREIATVSKFGQSQNSFQQSGLWGAGFQNVVSTSPLVPGVVLAGGDVSGIHRSTDYGDTWVTQNQEITVFSDRAIADIQWHPTQKDRVFRVSGNGTQGSFWESLDQGQTWAKRSTVPAAAGTSHTGLTTITGEHPRSVGHLIVIDTVHNYVYVATYNDGIYRATLGATSGIGTFSRIALGPNSTGGAYYIRSLVQDSNDADTLYASTYFNAAATEGTTLSGRVWRIENASTASPNPVQFTNSPMCTEDMVHLGTTLYGVAYQGTTGDRGLWTLDQSLTAPATVARGSGLFSNWLNRTTAVPYTTEVWYSIDGILSGQNLTLYCGCTSGVADAAGAYKVLFKVTSADAGATMTSAAIHPDTFSTGGTTGSVRKQVGGISGERDWWLFPKQTTSMFGGGPGYAAADIAIDKSGSTTSGGGTGGGAKNPIQGIIDPNVSTIPSGYSAGINALTVYLDWVDLQPTSTNLLDGGDVTVLDNMLTYAAANNIYIKVRLFTGAKHSQSGVTGAPAWLVSQTGTFLSKNAQDAGNATAIAKFWTTAFKTAYDKLMQLMAARWDSNARLLDITISGAMTRYAEPFIRDLGTPQNRAELVGGGTGWGGTFIAAGAPGYTDALNQSAHRSFIDSHATWWTTTNSSLSFNPYQRLDSYSSFTTNDIAIRRSILAYFKNALGARGVIENNSIRPDYFTYDASGNPTGFSQTVPSYTTMYQDHLTYGPPSFYQTANNTQITNATFTTVASAMQATQLAADQILLANAVEPSSGVGSFTAANVAAWNTTLKNNPLPASTGGTQYPNKARVFIAGRSGVWRTQNADAATASVLFYPDVRNLGVTINRPLLCDPNNPDIVYSGSTDWTFIYSTDAMATVGMNDTGITASVGLCIAVDETTNPSTVYLGVGTRDTNTLGGVYTNPTPTSGTTWTTTNLETAAGGAQPIGLTFMRNATNQTVLIAAVTGQIPGDATNAANAGLYRKVGTAAWAKVTNVTPSGVVMVGEASRAATMTSRRGSPNVYLMDGASGVWRSTDYGASWTRILIHTASNADYVGYISSHPTDTSIIYLSLSTGIFQINNASTVAQDSAVLTDISGGIVQNPGAMKVTSDGFIYCIGRVNPKLWRSTTTTPVAWSSIDDAVFRDTSIFAQDIDIDTNSRAYVATNGNGIIRQVTTSYSDDDAITLTDTATVATSSQSPIVADTALLTDTASVATVAGPPTGTGTKKKWPKRS